MKKTLLLLTVFVSIVLVSCSKLKDLAKINFDVPYTQSVALPTFDTTGTGGVFPPAGISYSFPAMSVATNSQATLTQYNTSASKVDSMVLKSLALQLSNSGNFDFVDTIKVYITGTGQSTQLLAYEYGIAKGQSTLTLNPVDIDLKPYFLLDSMGLQLQAHFTAFPPSGATLNVSSHFTGYANLLN